MFIECMQIDQPTTVCLLNEILRGIHRITFLSDVQCRYGTTLLNGSDSKLHNLSIYQNQFSLMFMFH